MNFRNFITVLFLGIFAIGAVLPGGFVFGAMYQNINPTGDQTIAPGAADFESGEAVWVNNTFVVRTRAGGTGTLRSVQLTTGASNVGLVVNSSGNVGVGTSTPSYKLDVVGTTQITGSFGNPNSETAYRLKFFDNGGTYNDSGIGLDGSAGGEKMWFNTVSGFYFNYGTALQKVVFDTSGNVGIATTTPSYKLDVVGGGQFSQPIVIGTPTIAGHAATKSYVDSSVTGSASQWTTTSTGVYYSSGNVGIGTTAPTNKLTIEGTETTDTTYLRISNRPTTAGAAHKTALEFWGSDNVTNGGSFNAARIYAQLDATSYGSSRLTLGSASGIGTFNDELTLKNGNVGIGAVSPSEKLEVNGNLKITGDNQLLKIGASNDLNLWHNSDVSYIQSNTGDFKIINYANGYLSFATNNTEKVRITSAGNVGIATTTPSYKLDVVGGGQFSQPIVIGTPTIAGHAATKSYVDSSVTGSASQWTTTSTGVYYSSGNVGIGTTSPGAALHVKGAAIKLQELTTDAGASFQFVRGLDGIARNMLWTTPSGTTGKFDLKFGIDSSTWRDIYIGTNNAANGIVLKDGGNVGIGTTNPGMKLHVNGSFKAVSSGGTAQLDASGNFIVDL